LSQKAERTKADEDLIGAEHDQGCPAPFGLASWRRITYKVR
jgi:hypothetical protein